MKKAESFAQFLQTQSATIPMVEYILNLLLAALLGYILSLIYVRFGESLSNRRMFGKNFVLLTATTMIIITIVKSSLALSLGLVGALSIVRFRAAIKEPEELAYLFLSIAIGLGMGANQTAITLVGFAVASLLIIILRVRSTKKENQNLVLTVSSNEPAKSGLDLIVQTLNQHCAAVNLKRIDEMKSYFEASFLVEFSDFEKFKNCKRQLHSLDDSLKITFLDNKGIVA
jgi:uncharacterized membrane protein YhiD involved in acid resistance